jgi:MFS family permease
VVAGSLITMGTLGDRIGRRRLLMFGAAAFGVVSVLAAYIGLDVHKDSITVAVAQGGRDSRY